MAFLLDTNVLSELRKDNRCDQNVTRWQASIHPSDCFVSVVTLMELKRGILAVATKNPEFSITLKMWYDHHVKERFKILPVSTMEAEYAGSLLTGRTRGLADTLIAATAIIHDLTLATRNVPHFLDAGVRCVNPWEDH